LLEIAKKGGEAAKDKWVEYDDARQRGKKRETREGKSATERRGRRYTSIVRGGRTGSHLKNIFCVS